MALQFLFGGFFAFGAYFILLDFFKIPSLRAKKAILAAANEKNGSAKTLETAYMNLAMGIAKYVPMDDYRRARLENILRAAGMSISPESYTAYALLKGGSVLLLIVPIAVIFPLLIPVPAVLSVMIYFKEIRRADEALAKKREEIEKDLPRFAASIQQELKASRDILTIIESFRRNAGETFKKEFGILSADMRSGGYETALSRFESRYNSAMLSDISRGFKAVLRGDDSTLYFQVLSEKFRDMEISKLKKEALKIPSKIRVFSFIMLLAFLLTWLAIIGFEIVRALGNLF